MRLLVGLGNPGTKYAHNRHNIGFMAVDEIVRRHGLGAFRAKFQGELAEGKIGIQKVLALKPMTFMNESGQAVAKLVHRHGIDDPARIVIVHDELDLPVGELRVKSGGGLAGHNGLRSITAHLKTQDYLRVRIGVGKPPGRQSGADHVLRRPGAAEATELEIVAQEAADAVEVILAEGVAEAMSRFNSRS